MSTSIELNDAAASWDQEVRNTQSNDGMLDQDIILAQADTNSASPAVGSDPVPVDAGSGAPLDAKPAAVSEAATTTFVADANNVVRLPTSVSIDKIKVQGNDLVLQQADGSVVTIKDAASNVPSFMIGDVEVPRVALLAALESSGINVAFGVDGSISAGGDANTIQSSGGNFSIPAGSIGDPFDLSDLLPPTALVFPELERRELSFGVEKEKDIDTQPTINAGPVSLVNEAALSDGSNPGSSSESTSGAFDVDAGANGLGSLVVNGVDVTFGGTVVSNYGTLNVTGTPTTGYTWVFTLTGNTTDHPDGSSTGTSEGIFDNFVVVVTDSDGDSATDTLQIDILDDGPTASLALLTGTVDEDGVPNGLAGGIGDVAGAVTVAGGSVTSLFNSGADAPLTYALSLTTIATLSALNLTSGGAALSYVLVGDTVTASANGAAVFTFQVSAAGAYTFTLLDQLDHATGADENDLLINLGAIITATDADGDTVTAAANGLVITVDDDTPTAVIPEHAVLSNGAGASFIFDLDPDNNLTNNYGADGGTIRFSPALDGGISGLTSNNVPILYDVSANGLTLVATANGVTIFTVILNPATGTYSVDMDGIVDSRTTIDFNSGGYDFAGGSTAWNGFVPNGAFTSPVDDNSPDLLLTPEVSGLNAGTINTSNLAGGVGNTVVGANETFRVDFVTDLRGNPAGGGGYDNPGNQDHVFDGHYTVNGSSAAFAGSNGSTIRITAYDDADGNNVVGDGAVDPLTKIVIAYNGSSQLIDLTLPLLASYVIGGHTYTVTLNGDGTINVGGVFSTGSAADPVATTIATFTANGYNSVEYTYVSGDEFNIGNFGAATPSTNPVNFELPVQIVDGDGDVAGSSIGITLAAAGQGISNNSASLVGVTLTSSGVTPHIIGSDHADTLTGNSAANILFGGLANDILSGGLGDDTLIGGLGQDTMTGGGGADAFVVSADAIGGSINDIITDYNFGQGDSIDLTELLNNLVGVTNLEGGGYVNITAGANAQVQVDVDGSANGVNFQTVAVLQGYTHVDEAIKILFDDGSTIKSDLA